MQCNFLGYTDRSHGLSGIQLPENCIAGPGEYKTTTEDQETYCKKSFMNCPRYTTRIQLEKLNQK